MKKMQFKGEVWKQGNSLILTIPKEIREAYGLVKGDFLDIDAAIVDRKLGEEEKEAKRLRATHQYEASGVMLHKGEEIAYLEKVFLTEIKFRGGGVPPGGRISDLPLRTSVVGVILKGRFLPNIFSPNHYGLKGIDIPRGKYLLYEETMELVTEDGRKVNLHQIEFETPLYNTHSSGLRIQKREFHATPVKESK